MISILLPALSKARETAKAIQCASTLRQMGLANHIYANDNDEWFVPIQTERMSSSSAEMYWWRYYPWPHNPEYRRSLGLVTGPPAGRYWARGLMCPAAPQTDLLRQGDITKAEGVYGMNYDGDAYGEVWTDAKMYSRLWVKNPSGKAQAADANMYGIYGSTAANPVTGWDLTREQTVKSVVTYRHNEAANLLFVDGHAALYDKARAYPMDTNARQELWRIENPSK